MQNGLARHFDSVAPHPPPRRSRHTRLLRLWVMVTSSPCNLAVARQCWSKLQGSLSSRNRSGSTKGAPLRSDKPQLCFRSPGPKGALSFREGSHMLVPGSHLPSSINHLLLHRLNFLNPPRFSSDQSGLWLQLSLHLNKFGEDRGSPPCDSFAKYSASSAVGKYLAM